jgi:hypothetical protein
MLLGEALQLEAYQSPGLYIEPFAEFLAAHFRLTTAVHSRTTCHELLKFNSPADLWFYSCTVMSAHHLAQDGLTGVPLLMGKREAWQWAVKITANLRALSYKPDPMPTMLKDPTTFVILEAQEIAKVDKDFYTAHLLPYIQSARRAAKKNKECSNVQFHYLLPNGTLFETGEKKKLPRITSIKK